MKQGKPNYGGCLVVYLPGLAQMQRRRTAGKFYLPFGAKYFGSRDTLAAAAKSRYDLGLSESYTMRETFFSGGLRWLIKTTDALLRRIGGITEFETEVKGLLRIELSHATRTLTLPDGTRVQRGVPIMDLHFWNEHLPPFLSEVDNFDWASRVEQQIQTSLHRLVLFIHARQEPDKVQALRVTLSIAKHGPPSVLARLLMKAGFEPIESPTSGTVCFMPILEGIWAWLLTWTYNPRGLIDWRFNRTRREFWVSRQQLLARYARAIS
jgi:hypothetical protein